MKEGPFKQAVESEKSNLVRETYTVLIERGGWLIEETNVRQWTGEDYIDSSYHLPIRKVQ